MVLKDLVEVLPYDKILNLIGVVPVWGEEIKSGEGYASFSLGTSSFVDVSSEARLFYRVATSPLAQGMVRTSFTAHFSQVSASRNMSLSSTQ